MGLVINDASVRHSEGVGRLLRSIIFNARREQILENLVWHRSTLARYQLD
jgi:hypothetical protein